MQYNFSYHAMTKYYDNNASTCIIHNLRLYREDQTSPFPCLITALSVHALSIICSIFCVYRFQSPNSFVHVVRYLRCLITNHKICCLTAKRYNVDLSTPSRQSYQTTGFNTLSSAQMLPSLRIKT